MWVDVTWGAGGSTADKTLEICINAQKYHGLNVMMHLTCTNMPKESLHAALSTCKEHGIRNILALRGDPPAGVNQGEWKQVEGGFAYATDLVKYIRKMYGDYFCIGVAGYPEGHLEATSKEDDMKHLKEKIDAGADLIVTQLFYDNAEFANFVQDCNKMGIEVPILPGIRPVQSYGGFTRMTGLCKTKVPNWIQEKLDAVKDEDEKVKDAGVEIAVQQCKDLLDRKLVPGLHFYTLNMETSVCRIVEAMGLVDDSKANRKLPWRPSAGHVRKGEDVRPIFWANRPGSYLKRTATWDDFPNGRFSDSRSPAYGECTFVSFSKPHPAKQADLLRDMWGKELTSFDDVAKAFAGYIRGDVKRLPWCDERPASETSFISKQLLKLNQLGLLTINSQPRVNAALSTDPYVGWGAPGGFVFQKSYIEFFCSAAVLGPLLEAFKGKSLSYMAVNKKGDVKSNVKQGTVNAVTWGCFPDNEIKQPTVVDTNSFMAWKDEAFELWSEWQILYEKGTPSRELLDGIVKSMYLVNIVDEDFVSGDLAASLIEIVAGCSDLARDLKTGRTFLFSSESVNEGHPDKLCDQVSDAVLDACLKEDPRCKVACETACKDNMVMVFGEITTSAKLDYDAIVRKAVEGIGYDSFEEALDSVNSKGLNFRDCEVQVRINKQSPDIAGGVHVGKDDLNVGAGDQGIMFGYASDETEDCMPLTHLIATRLGKKLTDVRKDGSLWWLRPDGKTQVTIEYQENLDGSMEPLKIHTVVISTQHAEPSKAVRSKECDGYKGPEMTAPTMEMMNKHIEKDVIVACLEEIKLKNGKPAVSLYGDHTHLHINPSGKFIIGGRQGDAGLTGRKIIIDTYGGRGAHGGGAFSGKDPTKVDRSAAYVCRQMAKSVVKSGLCKRALVQLSYAIGVAKPLSLFVETYGTEKEGLTPTDITNVIKIEFDCRPGAIAVSLALREPKYQPTAAYGHFGRDPYTEDGIKFFEWENAKDLKKYAKMTSKQVSAELKSG